MSAAIVTVAVDSTTQRLLLVLAAVLGGASVGLLGALLFGAVSRADAVRMAAPPPVPTRAFPDARVEPEGPSPFSAPGIAAVPALYAVDGDVVRERHRDLYAAEYVKQLDHVDELRRTVGTRLAVAGESHQPREPDPSEEFDA